MTDSQGRKIYNLNISREWFPDYMVTEAFYEDGSLVPEEELIELDNDEIGLYLSGLK